ncbi:MAG: hypothetical protein EBT79_02185 [Actinobacteria bacterium]|nr:hypothetical protein [Actinomycetota bacterium]NBR66083.1 hypothetical protein [Actinomycetota bacterium]
MAKLTRRGAANVTTDLDKIATLFQNRAAALGVPEKIAHDFAYRCDLLSDHIEKYATRLAAEGDEDAEDDEVLATAGKKKAAIDETGTSIEPGPDDQGFDANEIGDMKAGPLEIITPPDEPWMGGHFTQEKYVALTEKQQSGELAANAAAGKADPKLASIEASLAKLAKLAALGTLTDTQAESAVKKLLELENALTEVEAEIETLASAALTKQKGLEAEHKKVLATLKENLPQTIVGQKATILKVRTAIIKYTKAPERKRPGFEQMRSTDTESLKEKGGDLFGRIEAELGAEIAAKVGVIADTVWEELTHIQPVVRGLKYEVENAPKTASARTAGVLDVILKFRAWIGDKIGQIMSLFKLGTGAIDGAADSLIKSLGDAEKAIGKTAASKHKSEDEVIEAGEEVEAPKKGGKSAPKKAADAYDLFTH